MSYLQKVCSGLGQLAGKELKVVLVEATLKMSLHFFFVERTELAHRTCKHHPGKIFKVLVKKAHQKEPQVRLKTKTANES